MSQEDEEDGQNISDSALNASAHKGDERLRNAAAGRGCITDTAASFLDGKSEYVFLQQAQVMGLSSLRANYVELLRRSRKLVSFMQDNIGDSSDWPLELSADNEVTLNILRDSVADVESAVGCLTEL